jgi:transposase
VAIREILAGKSITQAARAAKADWGSVYRWLKQIRRFGFQSLLVDGRHGHAKRTMKPSEVEQTRRQIAAALAQQLKSQVRERLTAIDAVLSGVLIDDAAAAVRVQPDTVRDWVRAVTRDGITRSLARWESVGTRVGPSLLDADPASFREQAAKERDPRIRKRMLALAFVADGRSPHDADMRSGLAPTAVPKWIVRFRKEGVAGLRMG